MSRKFLTIILALGFLAIVVMPVAAMPAVKKLATPSLLSPANNARLTNGDHLAMLEWNPVNDPRVVDYLVEVQGFSIPWDYWMGFTSTPRVTTNSWYQVDCFPAGGGLSDGFFDYRWRVTARAGDAGSNSAPSNWQYFSFPAPQPTVRLPAIRLISPGNKIRVSAGTDLSYTWELIPGDVGNYLLIHERLDANNQWRGDTPTTVFSDSPTLPFVSSQWQTTTGIHRWRVFAYGPGGSLSLSPWRTYTVV